MEYLYSDGSHHHFMNTETYEQVALTEDELGDAAQWLMAGLKIEVEFYNGTPIGVALPASMELDRCRHRTGYEGRHGLKFEQTCYTGKRCYAPGPALHRPGRADQGKSERSKIYRTSEIV